jgi:hypothetical protein
MNVLDVLPWEHNMRTEINLEGEMQSASRNIQQSRRRRCDSTGSGMCYLQLGSSLVFLSKQYLEGRFSA